VSIPYSIAPLISDDNESPIDALKREILEETGYTIKDIVYITTIGVEYNPLNRIDVSRVYVCHIDENTNKTALLDYEKEIFNSFDFYDLETIEETFKTIHDEKVSKLIYQRDLYAINKYKKMCKK
jgi:8-oxo-dGTP pyrophosphatase MutT (NUDIX family)